MLPFSWGLRNPTVFTQEGTRGGVQFKVNGRKFQGLVTVVLTGSDLYRIAFFNRRMRKVHETPEIFVDQMIETIDNFVET
jgi:hypothetical protein